MVLHSANYVEIVEAQEEVSEPPPPSPPPPPPPPPPPVSTLSSSLRDNGQTLTWITQPPAAAPAAAEPEPEPEPQGVAAIALYEYVSSLHQQSRRSRTCTDRPVHSYDAAEDNELTFREGDRIVEIEAASEDWWQGRDQHGNVGLFPGESRVIHGGRKRLSAAGSELRGGTRIDQGPWTLHIWEVERRKTRRVLGPCCRSTVNLWCCYPAHGVS